MGLCPAPAEEDLGGRIRTPATSETGSAWERNCVAERPRRLNLSHPKSLTKVALQALDRFFEGRSRNTILLISLALALLIGAVDYRGSTAFLIAYLAPIALAAWYGGSRVGAVIAIYCTIAWYIGGQIAEGFRGMNAVDFWSTLARMAIFLIMSKVISRLRERAFQQQEMMQFVVHDLRSPISSAITGLMTLQQMRSTLDDTESEMVDLALVSNQRALTLVNSMLDVERFESGKLQPQFEPASIDELIGQAIQQVSLWAAGEDVRIVPDVEVPNGVLDFDLTLRVLVNLLSNALKYSPQGGEIHVEAHAWHSAGLRFVVEDHGKGIPPEYLQAIFEPFTQVKGTKGGSGLGLTFCRLAVHAQGGKIWAESTLGKGTKMIFTLPAHTPNRKPFTISE